MRANESQLTEITKRVNQLKKEFIEAQEQDLTIGLYGKELNHSTHIQMELESLRTKEKQLHENIIQNDERD